MSSPLHRRQFLNDSALGATAAGLALSQLPASAAAPPQDQLVVGVMGLSRGSSLARTFATQPGVTVKYVCDIDSTRAERCARQVEQVAGSAPLTTGDFRHILDDKTVDALVCAAPNHWHAPATILACNAGKHVYVEKPCSHNPQEGEWMVQAARDHRCAVQMGTQRRSFGSWQEATERLGEDVIGRVYLARCWYNNARGSIGRGQPAKVPSHIDYQLWQGPAPRRPYLDNVVHYNWHWRWHWGNGELGNNGVHTLDLCRWGLGVDYPIRVTSSGGRYHWDDDQETPDTHTVCFEFEGGKQISWQGLSCNRHRSGFITFYGDQGTMEVDSNGEHRIFDKRDKLVTEHKAVPSSDGDHVGNFLAAIRKGELLNLNAEIAEGHKSTLLCHLGNIAHRTGHTLRCNAEDGHIQDDAAAQAFWRRDYAPGWEPMV